tara:strand:+ start:69 stop:335 length:267 start_codon:yes stop_codon:yes gene_type:complete
MTDNQMNQDCFKKYEFNFDKKEQLIISKKEKRDFLKKKRNEQEETDFSQCAENDIILGVKPPKRYEIHKSFSCPTISKNFLNKFYQLH